MTILYRNSSGKEVTHSSYSSRQTFSKCPRQFQLERVQGWSDKAQRAAPLFGKCIESGLQVFEENNRRPDSGVEVFVRMWNDVQLVPDFKNLIYTATEGSWEQLLESGKQLLKLYEFRAPKLPIVRPLFQQRIRKTIFPGTNLAMLENVAVLDILSFPPWNHPMLPPVPMQDFAGAAGFLEGNPVRELITDVKTAGKDFPTELVSLDPQLAEYAWQTRIPDVAFLWFVKASHSLKRGARVSLLRTVEPLWAGWDGCIVELIDNELNAPTVMVGGWNALRKHEEVIKGIRGKALDAARKNSLDGLRAEGGIIEVLESDVTKQRIQFAAARLTDADMDEVGRSVAKVTVEMVRACEEDFYPRQAGVRFPNEKCGFCSMRFHCLHDADGRDKNLTKRGEEWLDGYDVESE